MNKLFIILLLVFIICIFADHQPNLEKVTIARDLQLLKKGYHPEIKYYFSEDGLEYCYLEMMPNKKWDLILEHIWKGIAGLSALAAIVTAVTKWHKRKVEQ